MPYITSFSKFTPQQIDIYDLLYRGVEEQKPLQTYRDTHTTHIQESAAKYPEHLTAIITRLYSLAVHHFPQDLAYQIFRIPKASGGFREIQAPNPELKEWQRDVIHFFRHTCQMLWHNNAFAYIEGRSAVDALRLHQQNNSNWFLKLDVKDFFPSWTVDDLLVQLFQLYPFNFFLGSHMTHPCAAFTQLIKGCCRNNQLPQGAPTSPILSNLVMIPCDHQINKELYNYKNHRFIYTRYADDLLISCKEAFDPAEIKALVASLLPSNLKFNDDKTRYGSKAGRNWNLGLMLNQHNDITLGYKEKQRLRAAIDCFARTLRTEPWQLEDRAHLAGQLAYLKHIEPEYHAAVLSKYNAKYNLDITEELKLNI